MKAIVYKLPEANNNYDKVMQEFNAVLSCITNEDNKRDIKNAIKILEKHGYFHYLNCTFNIFGLTVKQIGFDDCLIYVDFKESSNKYKIW